MSEISADIGPVLPAILGAQSGMGLSALYDVARGQKVNYRRALILGALLSAVSGPAFSPRFRKTVAGWATPKYRDVRKSLSGLKRFGSMRSLDTTSSPERITR